MKFVFGWLPEQVVLLADDLLEGRELAGWPDPPRPQPQFEPAFVEAVVGLPELGGVGGVDQHRNPQLAGLVPQRRQARVVDRNPVAVGVPIRHSKALEDFQARSTVPHVLFQLRGSLLAPAGFPDAEEVGVGEEDEARRMPRGHVLEPVGQRKAAAAGEVHHDRHVELVHLTHQALDVGGRTSVRRADGRECPRTGSWPG